MTWTNPCSDSSCSYVTSTLVDDKPDPQFDIVHMGLGQPFIDAGDLTSNVGDSLPFAGPTLQSGSGVAPFTWAATGLPGGLTMATDGTITGTITNPFTNRTTPSMVYTVAVTVIDGLIQRASASFVWTVRRPLIDTPPTQTSQIGAKIKPLQLTSRCWKTPCTYTMVNKPAGLTLDSGTGLITGSPATAGTVTATVTITDGNGVTATSDPFSWAVLTAATVCVSEIALANGSFEDPVVKHGAPNWMVGGSTPLLWDTTESDNTIELWQNDGPGPQASITAQAANGGQSITAENGNQWAELNANYVGALYEDLTTVPGQILQWSVWHRGRYSSSANASKKDVMQVQIGSIASQSAQVPTGQTTAAISDGPTAWVLYRGVYTVPANQTNTRFQFAAISTASGNNSIGNFIDNLSLNNYVACLPDLPGAQTSTINKLITPIQLSASRGSGSFVWGGNATLPAGITMTADGKITGTPTGTGTTSVVLTLTDMQTTFEQSVAFDWTVVPKPETTAPSNQTTSVGGMVSLPVVSTCPNTPCSYAIDYGPSGLTVTNSGVVTGTVTGPAQSFSAATITVTDNAGVSTTSTPFTWTVNAAPVIPSIVNQKTLRGASVSLDIGPASGGTAPYTYSTSRLPTWLTINSSSGKITGTASTSTDSIATGITITLHDSTGATSTTSPFSWTVYAAPTVAAPVDQSSSVGATVNLALITTCPNAPCTYTFNSNAPAGLGINSVGMVTGAITGPAKAYPDIVVTVTDAGREASVSGSFTWTVTS